MRRAAAVTVENESRIQPFFPMKLSFPLLAAVVGVLALSLPASRSHSQLAPAAVDPVAELQALQNANEDLLKRQDATLKDLTEMTDNANEIRIYSRRG